MGTKGVFWELYLGCCQGHGFGRGGHEKDQGRGRAWAVQGSWLRYVHHLLGAHGLLGVHQLLDACGFEGAHELVVLVGSWESINSCIPMHSGCPLTSGCSWTLGCLLDGGHPSVLGCPWTLDAHKLLVSVDSWMLVDLWVPMDSWYLLDPGHPSAPGCLRDAH